MEADQKTPPVESEKLTKLRQMIQKDVAVRELLLCLNDGLWHTTSELARHAKKSNPVIGLVTVGTILGRIQQQLGEHFLETMVQPMDEGVSSWRIGVEWLDVVNAVLKQSQMPASST
ncbi:MAG: hypothetical protein ACFFD8_07915 [Candidatus Thorarchaeota archaeon]